MIFLEGHLGIGAFISHLIAQARFPHYCILKARQILQRLQITQPRFQVDGSRSEGRMGRGSPRCETLDCIKDITAWAREHLK